MSGNWERTVRDFVEPRGWLINKTNGNHIKITHPQVNRALFTSSTPSDRMTIAALRTKVRVAEKDAGINDHLRNSKPALRAEPFPMQHDGDKLFLMATCQSCGAFDRQRMRKAENPTAQNNFRFALRQGGWTVGRKRRDDRCPKCIGKPAKALAIVSKSDSSIRSIVTAAELSAERKAKIERDRQANAAATRRALRALDRAYLPTNDGYIAGESDATVAARAKVSEATVAQIREAHFGPPTAQTAVAAIRAEAKALSADMSKFQGDVIDALAALEGRLGALIRAASGLRKEPQQEGALDEHRQAACQSG